MSAVLLGGLRDKGFSVLSSDQKLGVGQGTRYVYADVTVVCGPLRLQPGTSGGRVDLESGLTLDVDGIYAGALAIEGE